MWVTWTNAQHSTLFYQRRRRESESSSSATFMDAMMSSVSYSKKRSSKAEKTLSFSLAIL